MTRLLFSIAILSTTFFGFAQGWNPVGARSQSLANASVCLTDVWAFHHNPGALAYIDKTSVGLSYENRFTLKELQTQGFVVAHPLKKGVLSVGGQFYGYQLYRSTRIGLGYSMLLTEKLAAGVQINYQGLRISDYGSQGTLSGEIGLLAKINDEINIGFSIFNANRAKLSSFQDDRYSTYLRLGLSYKLSSKVMLLAEAEKEVQSQIRPKGAIEYEVVKNFKLRLGAAGNPTELTFGIGYAFAKGFQLDAGSAWHQILGWSPHVGLTYGFNKKKNE